jgi:DNA polymerase
MFVNPKLVLNVPLLEKTAKEEGERRANIFKEIGIDKAEFASNVKFPKLLLSKGYEVPTKKSLRTGKDIPALALGDPEFLEMVETENEELKSLCEARIAAKSTLLETRSTKLSAIGKTGLWPFDVEFSGADQTHRFSGGGGAGGNPQNFTRGSALRAAVEVPEGYSLVVGDFCVVPWSQILKADLTWVRADQLQVGDELIGFEEALPCRTFKPSFITGKSTKVTQCRTVQTSQGPTTVSNDHMFVVKRRLPAGGYHREWVKAIDLQIGDEIIFLGRPWETDTSRDGGWLAGIFDGEGWISHQKIGFGQNDGTVLDTALQMLDDRGFTEIYRKKNKSGCNQILINGGREHLRLLGMLRPVRLMKKQRTLWENRRTWHNSNNLSATVEGLSFGGIREVISLQTSTKTFISDGFFSHNCNIELRIVAYLSKDPGLVQAIEKGIDLYCDFASVFYGRRISKADEVERRFGKCAILGLGYGMGATKFAKTVRLQTGRTLSEEDAKKAVELYRTRYAGVPRLWERLDDSIRLMKTTGHIEPSRAGQFVYEAVLLPSGLKIRYPNLRQVREGRHTEWVYDVYNKRKFEQRKLYGGKLLENISQALAGELCKEAMLQMGDNVTGLVHDEIHVLCKKGLELQTAQKLKRVMSISPKWLPEIRLDAEVSWGKSWGAAK